MRVAIVTHNVRKGDGQGRVNYELARYLLQSGVDLTLVADNVAPELVEMGAKWVEIHPAVTDVILLKVWHFQRLADRHLIEHRANYDLIMACGVVLDQPHDVNVVHFVHRAWMDSPSHPIRTERGVGPLYQGVFTWLNTRWEGRVLRKARRVVAVSEQIRSELTGPVGLPAAQVSTIVNGVDIDEFIPGAMPRDELGLPEHVPLAFFAGDIRSSRKNLDSVLKALVDVPELHLAVAGDTAGSPYPQLAKELDVASRAHFLGFRRDVASLMQASDFFVFPSRYEACTLVLLEAMAVGLPVITARTAGGAELVGKGGYVLDDPEDVASLTKRMRALAQSPGKREKMGRAARGIAEQHSWGAMSSQYLDLFNEVAEQHLPQQTLHPPSAR